MESNWEQIIATARLVSLPEAYLNLKQVLDQPDYSMAEVAIAINRDPALTARILRLVNSSYFGFSSRIDTVFRAVNMLGSQQVYELALATSVAQTFDGMDSAVINMAQFWRQSVLCALISKNLAKACQSMQTDSLFVAGLLHNIGHLVMYQAIPGLCQQAMIQSQEQARPLYLVERELIGLDYARISCELMRQWHLPHMLRETGRFHLEPDRALEFPLQTCVVHIAARLTEAEGNDMDDLRLNPAALAVSGLSLEQCKAIRRHAELEVAQVLSAILPADIAC
jgi:HD-like signal output (HDOD) protein